MTSVPARTVQVVVDNDSWILPYAESLVAWANQNGDAATLRRSYDEVAPGDIAFFLGCVKLAPTSVLDLNAYTLVVHESDLPKGRGFAPVQWQILDGASTIPVCLLKVVEGADSGDIVLRGEIALDGHELNDEIRTMQGDVTFELCRDFLKMQPPYAFEAQHGEPSYYPKRRPSDSELDTERSLAQQFDLLRIVDNDRYPAFFVHRGHTYKLRIEKID